MTIVASAGKTGIISNACGRTIVDALKWLPMQMLVCCVFYFVMHVLCMYSILV